MVQAAILGKPILCSDKAGDGPEICKNLNNSKIYKSNNFKSFKKNFYLLQNKKLEKKINFKLANQFEISLIASKYLNVINEKKNKKILHIITSLGDGGAEGVLYRLIMCSNQNVKHSVVCLGPKDKYYDPLVKGKISVDCLDIKISNFIKKIKILSQIIKNNKPDLVQTWLYHADLIGGIVAKYNKVNKIFWNIRTAEINIKNTKILTFIFIKLCSFLSSIIPTKIISC